MSNKLIQMLKEEIAELHNRLKLYQACDLNYLQSILVSCFKHFPPLKPEAEDMLNLVLSLLQCSAADILALEQARSVKKSENFWSKIKF